jgi:4-carboxymuconolactone decarboxylase
VTVHERATGVTTMAEREFIGGDPAGKPVMDPLPREAWNEEVRTFFARMEGPVALTEGTRFNLPPIMAHNLPLSNAWLDYNLYLSSDKIELPLTLREIAILRIAWHMRAGYEWYQHRIIGRRCGLTDEQLAAVSEGEAASVWSEDERLAIRAADEIHAQDRVSRETMQTLMERLGNAKVLELLWTIGTYGLVAWINNSVESPIEEFALKNAE